VKRLLSSLPKPLGILRLISILLLALVVASVYSQPYFVWSVPPLWLPLVALAVLATSLRRVPVLASLFYLAGAMTLLWSLTPADTLLNTMWETIYLAAVAVGGSIPGFVLLNAWLLLIGLERTLLLDLFNLAHYFSGSAHYLAGAQGLLFVPFCLSAAVGSRRKGLRMAATLGAGACLLLILNSGARAVYWPAIAVLALTVLRLLAGSERRGRVVLASAAALALAFGFAAVFPGPTVWVPLGMKALTLEARPDADGDGAAAVPAGAVSEEGGIRSRLKMWDQAIRIGLEHPLGTGTGSFRNTIHAFQRYPLVGFSSAHNVFIEVFSTGGWLRAGLLIALLALSLWKGWTSDRWPFAVGAAGLWGTMSFDITGQMPAIMVLAFWTIATSRPNRIESPSRRWLSPRTALAGAAVLTGAGALAWWFLPCSGVSCAVDRHLGYRNEVARLSQVLDEPASRILAEQAVELNPESLWAWRLRADQATGPEERLTASRELASKFPLASPDLYLRWAEAALAAGQPEEARRAVLAGLEAFPETLSPAGVPFGGRSARYAEWLEAARRILERTDESQ
jgi:O-antigen ligase